MDGERGVVLPKAAPDDEITREGVELAIKMLGPHCIGGPMTAGNVLKLLDRVGRSPVREVLPESDPMPGPINARLLEHTMGARIVSVGRLTPDELASLGWERSPLVFVLDNGTRIAALANVAGTKPGMFGIQPRHGEGGVL